MAAIFYTIYIDDVGYSASSAENWTYLINKHEEITSINGKVACNGKLIYKNGVSVNENDSFIRNDGEGDSLYYTTTPLPMTITIDESSFTFDYGIPWSDAILAYPDRLTIADSKVACDGTFIYHDGVIVKDSDVIIANGQYTKLLPGLAPSIITTDVDITSSNISDYFTVTNSSYYFAGSGSTFTSNNKGVHSSTAQTTLTLLRDMTVSFNYSYSSEKNYDKFTLKVGSTTIENAVSGTTTSKIYAPTALTKGTQIVFTYSKDSSANSNNDECTFSAMHVSYTETFDLKKGLYVGADTPIYGPDTTETVTVNITTANIEQYFTVANGSFYFAGSGSTFTTNNAGYHSTTASTTLTLKRAMRVTFTYVYSSEAGYDKFSLKVGSSYVVQNVSGSTTSRTYGPTQLEAGTQIVFTYYKDGSNNGYNDRCFFTNMQVSYEEPVPGEIVGYTSTAHNVKNIYIGVPQDRVEQTYADEAPDTGVSGYYGVLGNSNKPVWDDTQNHYKTDGTATSDAAIAYVEEYMDSAVFIPADDLRTAYVLKFDNRAGSGTIYNKYVTTSIAGNFARKVKKAYVGVNGVARLCYVALINFALITVNKTYYQAEEGMTWQQWVDSKYNTDGFVIAGGGLLSGKGGWCIPSEHFDASAIIKDGYVCQMAAC